MFEVENRVIEIKKGVEYEVTDTKLMYGDSFIKIKVKQSDKPDRLIYFSDWSQVESFKKNIRHHWSLFSNNYQLNFTTMTEYMSKLKNNKKNKDEK